MLSSVQKRAKWLGRHCPELDTASGRRTLYDSECPSICWPEARHGGGARTVLSRFLGLLSLAALAGLATVAPAKGQALTLVPSEGEFDATFTATANFPGLTQANKEAYLYLWTGADDPPNIGSAEINCADVVAAGGVKLATETTNSDGDATFSDIAVSGDFVPGENNRLCSQTKDLPPPSTSQNTGLLTFTVTSPANVPTLTLTPSTVPFDGAFTAVASNFEANEYVYLVWTSSLSRFNSCAGLGISQLGSGWTSAEGGITFSDIAVTDSRFIPGNYNYLCARTAQLGAGVGRATQIAKLNVTPRVQTIALTPGSAPFGTTLAVTGRGYTPNTGASLWGLLGLRLRARRLRRDHTGKPGVGRPRGFQQEGRLLDYGLAPRLRRRIRELPLHI